MLTWSAAAADRETESARTTRTAAARPCIATGRKARRDPRAGVCRRRDARRDLGGGVAEEEEEGGGAASRATRVRRRDGRGVKNSRREVTGPQPVHSRRAPASLPPTRRGVPTAPLDSISFPIQTKFSLALGKHIEHISPRFEFNENLKERKAYATFV